MARKKSDSTILTEIVKNKLKTNKSWAIRAMVRIFELNQEEEEQVSEDTFIRNGIGFSGADAQILSSFSKQVISGRSLSQKQLDIVMKKVHRYTKQVIHFIPEEKRRELIESK